MTEEQLMIQMLQTYDVLSDKPVLTPEESRLLEYCGTYIDTLGMILAAEYLKTLQGLAPPSTDETLH